MLIVIWTRRRTARTANTAWIGLVVATALMLVNIMVTTPRERIVRICHDLADKVDDGDIPGIGGHLAPDLVAEDLDKQAFLDRVRTVLTQYDVDRPYLYRFEVTFPSDDVGVAEFNGLTRVRSDNVAFDSLVIRWRLTFRCDGETWKVIKIEVVPSPQSPIRNLRFH